MSNGDNVPTDEKTPYTAVDPKANPAAFIMQNKAAVQRMPEDKQMRFIDMAFRRFMLPKYQAVNKQMPLSTEDTQKLRLQFASQLLDIPFEPTSLKGPEVKRGALEKGGAALAGAGAGVLGGVRSLMELDVKLSKLDKDSAEAKMASKIGGIEGKAYEEAKEVSPTIASRSAAVGHQIPSLIAAEGAGAIAGGVMGKGAGLGAKIVTGGVKGGVEGAAYGAAQPGGDPATTAKWGAFFGAAFPALSRMLGLGRGGVTPVERGAVSAGEKTGVAAPSSGKPTLESLKAEIEQQRAAKKAASTAKREALKAKKAGTTVEQTATRATKEAEAQATAAKQAEARRTGGGTPVQQATASQAVAENPQIKVSTTPPPTEGVHFTDSKKLAESYAEGGNVVAVDVPKEVYQQTVKGSFGGHATEHLLPKEWADKAIPVKEHTGEPAEGFVRMYRSEKPVITKTEAGAPQVTKVPEGTTGPKVRAKGGKPASPAQQKADAERQAKVRAEAKQQEFGQALEKHAQSMAGRYVGATVGIEHIPEIEEAVKEMEGGDLILKEMQKYRRQGKIDDTIYVEQLKDWMLDQLGGKE